jgi:hypothetical protein
VTNWVFDDLFRPRIIGKFQADLWRTGEHIRSGNETIAFGSGRMASDYALCIRVVEHYARSAVGGRKLRWREAA